jgi:hypothetical protein
MSQAFGQHLDLIINVASQNIDALPRTVRDVKLLLQAQQQLDSQRQNSASVLRNLSQQEQVFRQEIQNLGRRMLELTNVERQVRRERQLAVQRGRELRVEQARLAEASGDLAAAETHLLSAMRLTSRGSAERLRIERQLLGLRYRQASAIARQRREMELLRREGNALNAVWGGLTRGFNLFTRALASAVLIGFTARTVARSVTRFIVDPLQDMTTNALQSSDAFAQLDASLIGITGSMRAVRDLTSDIANASRGLPVTLLEATQGIRGLAFVPATAAMIQTPGDQRVEGIDRLMRILTGLATIDPEQGIMGARFSVREALAGEFRSLRFRFELSPSVIASTIGRSLEELKADPRLTLEALSTFVETFIGDEAFEEFSNLLSVQGKRFRGAMQEFFRLIGDEGIYDRITTFLRNAADQIETASRLGPDGQPSALFGSSRSISISLEFLTDELLDVLSSLINDLTGVNIDLADLDVDDVQQLGAALATVIALLSKFAVDLAQIVGEIGSFGGTIGQLLGVDLSVPSVEEQRRRVEALESQYDRALQNRITAQERDFTGTLGIMGRSIRNMFFPDRDARATAGPLDQLIPFLGFRRRGTAELSPERLERRIEAEKRQLQILELTEKLVNGENVTLEEILSVQEQISVSRAEIVKPLKTFQGQLESMFEIFGEFKVPDASRLGVFQSRLDALFGDSAESFASILTRSDESLQAMRDRRASFIAETGAGGFPELTGDEVVDAIIEYNNSIKQAIEQRNILIDAAQNKLTQSTQALLQELVGTLDALPAGAGSRRARDLLDFIGGNADVGASRFVSGTLPTDLGPRGRQFAELEVAMRRIREQGFETDFFRPELLKEVADLINYLGENIQTTTGDLEVAAETVDRYTTAWISFATTRAQVSDDPIEAERLMEMVGFLQDVQKEWQDTVDKFREKAAEEAARDAARAIADAIRQEAADIEDSIDRIKAAYDSLIEQNERLAKQSLAPLDIIPTANVSPLLAEMRRAFEESFKTVTDISDPASPAGLGRAINEQLASLIDRLSEQQSLLDTITQRENETLAQFLRRRETIGKEVEVIEETIKNLQDLREQNFVTAGEGIGEGLRGLLSAGPGAVLGLPPDAQVRELQNLLGLYQQIGRLQEQLSAAGIDGQALGIRPDDVQLIIPLIDQLGLSMLDAGSSASLTRDVVVNMIDDMIELFTLAGEDGPAKLVDGFAEAIARLDEMRNQVIETATQVDEAYVEAAQNISEAFGTFVVDGLIDAFNQGASGILDIARNLTISIQREFFRLVTELTVIRGIINPLLNSTFNLTGQNALPVNSQFGNVFVPSMSGPRVEPHQFGGIVSNPGAFVTSGGIGTIAEKEPEVIMPIAVTSRGELGVNNVGGGGQPIIIHMTVHAKDANSFRHAQRDIASQMRQHLVRN